MKQDVLRETNKKLRRELRKTKKRDGLRANLALLIAFLSLAMTAYLSRSEDGLEVQRQAVSVQREQAETHDRMLKALHLQIAVGLDESHGWPLGRDHWMEQLDQLRKDVPKYAFPDGSGLDFIHGSTAEFLAGRATRLRSHKLLPQTKAAAFEFLSEARKDGIIAINLRLLAPDGTSSDLSIESWVSAGEEGSYIAAALARKAQGSPVRCEVFGGSLTAIAHSGEIVGFSVENRVAVKNRGKIFSIGPISPSQGDPEIFEISPSV